MFGNSKKFNQPIGEWDVSNVEDMNNMFSGSFEFNQPIGEWNVSNCKNFDCMFAGSKKFNQNINKWVFKLNRINNLFDNAESFNRINCVWYTGYSDPEPDADSDDDNSDNSDNSDDEVCMCSSCKKERLRDLLEDMTAEDIVDVIQDFGF